MLERTRDGVRVSGRDPPAVVVIAVVAIFLPLACG